MDCVSNGYEDELMKLAVVTRDHRNYDCEDELMGGFSSEKFFQDEEAGEDDDVSVILCV